MRSNILSWGCRLLLEIRTILAECVDDDFRKEEWRKRSCVFHPQLNSNPIMDRDLGAGNRNKGLIEGSLQG